ncbi:glycosyltransferase [Candidatus Amoebophilus asiaticus]|nr:glycosyltransferase [Candidatus Amoebophilus asiaticus]
MDIPHISIYTAPHLYKKLVDIPPESDLGIVVVIPCYNEQGLLETLESLCQCDLPQCNVEVFVVINATENCTREVQTQNNKTFQEAIKWSRKNSSKQLKFHILNIGNLPKKDAGVGLARKTGMDEAWYRFKLIGNDEGLITSLDADCTCDKNYLTALEEHFSSNPNAPAGSIYFEHDLNGSADQNDAIINYELFIRYYINGLRYAGLPYAFHTIGSCFAVRSKVYEMQGGMNKRKAGEDFYFLHKVIPLGKFSEINNTRVIPSSRASDRVPFGTGMAINKIKKNENIQLPVYHPKTFKYLKYISSYIFDYKFISNHQLNSNLNNFPSAIKEFLERHDFTVKIDEIVRNTSSKEAFSKRFFRWFDALKTLQFVHFVRDNYYDQIPVEEAVVELFSYPENNLKGLQQKGSGSLELLNAIRKCDRFNVYKTDIFN